MAPAWRRPGKKPQNALGSLGDILRKKVSTHHRPGAWQRVFSTLQKFNSLTIKLGEKVNLRFIRLAD